MVFVSIVFLAINAGTVIKTVFLVRESGATSSTALFINVLTHELKTPVAPIRMYLQTLQPRA
jgi:signal transduction histidine kinase